MIYFILFAVVARLLPHPANFTPNIGLSLFAGSKFSRKISFLITVLSLLLSDFLLSIIYGYPILSYWSIFTYSWFIAVTLLSNKLWSKNFACKATFFCSASLGFWVWTNFGVWLTSAMYEKSFSGLVACYIAALPFLRNQIIGDLVWCCAIFGGYLLINRVRNLSFAQAKNNI